MKRSPAHLVTGLCVGYGCGACSTGMVVLSLVYGRSSPREKADLCWELSKGLRNRFEEEFGATCCPISERLNRKKYGSCQVCYVRGAELPVEMLLEARGKVVEA